MHSIVVVSHRRSGTHLTIDTIRNNFKDYGREKYLNIDKIGDQFEKDRQPISYLEEGIALAPRVLKTHFLPQVSAYVHSQEKIDYLTDLFASNPIIYVHRDGRDVMVSLYKYMQTYNPEIAKTSFSEFIRQQGDWDGIGKTMSRPAFWKYHIQSWRNQSGVNFINFEKFMSDYHQAVTEIAAMIAQPVPDRIVDVRRRDTFWYKLQRKLKRVLGLGQVQHTSVKFRKGGSGGYAQHFTPEDLEFFYQEVGKDFIKGLGYSVD
jgi:hypothetical protein